MYRLFDNITKVLYPKCNKLLLLGKNQLHFGIDYSFFVMFVVVLTHRALTWLHAEYGNIAFW